MAFNWMTTEVQKALEPKTSIISLIRNNLKGYRKDRSYLTTHASDITKEDWCPRKVALMIAEEAPTANVYIGAALQATFDVGNAVGDMVPEVWAGQSAYGNWECTKCEGNHTFTSKPDVKCMKGGRCTFKYVEMNFVSKEYDVSGSIDVFFDLGGAKKVATELKIINVEDFAKLAAPLAEHRLRTALYMKLIEDSNSMYKNMINLQEAKVFYVSRGFGKKNDAHNGEILPFKEFDVARNDEAIQPYLIRAKELKVYKETGKMPTRVCDSANCKLATKCSYSEKCFGMAD
jgi:hypothetical protein